MYGQPTLWDMIERENAPGWVYVMSRRSPCGTLYKLGYSTRPAQRARELGARLIACTPGTPGLERQYQRMFTLERLPGTEWFIDSERIARFAEGKFGHSPPAA
jgi:hypothetical protein